MSQRIMMHVSGATRPLAFGASLNEAPSLESGRTGWSGLPVEQHRLATWEGDVEAGPLSGESGMLVYLSGSVHVDAKLGGTSFSRRLNAGDASFMCGDDRHRYQRIQGAAEVLVVHLPSEWLTRAFGGNRAMHFDRTVALGQQPTLVSLAREMQAEVNRRGQTGQLFAESLSLAFVGFAASQLNPSAGKEHGRSLGPAERQKLREFMLSRLAEDISLSELAAVVGLGPRHFSKLFGSAFGCSPYRYVLNLRLAEAARLLTSTSRDVREIAYELGFCSQSHFTAMFRKAYGLTPARYGSGRRSTTM
jgi:AraC family transcriptional regulator